ncbi:hypothetical protein [Aliiroseovarius crassostreae]|uniref:hypothetical protein n=1 Tax=Aliiroseovarius crassostreae TaxID=154981 RepID=UPI003C7DDF77
MIVVTITIGILVSVFAAAVSIWFLNFGVMGTLVIAFGAGSITTLLLALRALQNSDCKDEKPGVGYSDQNGVSKT